MAAKSKSSKTARLSGLSTHSVHSTRSNRVEYQLVKKCSKSDINPCVKPKKVEAKEARIDQRRNPYGKLMTFRHLPMEDLEFHDEFIQYNLDFPTRVAIRLQYLMGTTMVDLNDKSYMENLHTGLLQEEEAAYQKTIKARRLKEEKRVKNLVLNGDMLPPSGMENLYKNAAFRVAQLIKRLDHFDRQLLVEIKPEHKIIPVEPFEYDSGGQYFVHLHKYGNRNFMPPEAVLANKLKRKAKIQRARERLRAQLKNQVNPELSFIFKRGANSDASVHALNGEAPHGKKRISVPLEVEKDSPSDSPPHDETDEEALTRIAESKHRRKLRKEQAHQEKEHKELAILFHDREREIAEKKIHREKEKEAARERKQVRIEELHKEQEGKYMQMLQKKLAQRAAMKPHLATALNKISQASMDSQQRDIEESASQKYLRQFYELPALANLEAFKAHDNPLVDRLDDSDMENPVGMFTYGHEVKLVYDREQAKTDDFLKGGLPQSNIS